MSTQIEPEPLAFAHIDPLGDRVVVVPSEASEKVGSLYIPGGGEEPTIGEVLERGDECTRVHLGERVLYGKYCGTEVQLNGRRVLILRETDILARVF